MNAGLIATGRRFRVSCLVCLIVGASNLSATGLAAATQEKTNAAPKQEAIDSGLRGRIIDETGAPVTDGWLSLHGPHRMNTKTDANGSFSFPPVRQSGEYRIWIYSRGWVGLKTYESLPKINLTPESREVRNFTLPRAAQVLFRIVNEEGEPCAFAQVHAVMLGSKEESGRAVADDEGWAVVGGLRPSETKYVFGVTHKEYAAERLVIRVTEPGASEPHDVRMRKGTTLKGKVTCSDGKPPAGWKMAAKPSAWEMFWPRREIKIAEDGSFELKHIVPREYRLTIGVPTSDRSSMFIPLLTADLIDMPQPLAIKMQYPSPASLTSISGTVEFEGKPHSVFLHVRSKDGRYSSGIHVSEDRSAFQINSIPKGIYTITAQSPTLKSLKIENVKAPTEGLKLTLKTRAKPIVTGRVLLPDGKTPAHKYRLSVEKLETIDGPNYSHDARWRDVESADGAFAVDVKSPGIYRATVLAEGFAPTVGEPFNTDEAGGPVDILLRTGVPLSGIVVDGKGQPIADALVQALSMAGRNEYGRTNDFASEEGSVRTGADGRFRLHHLPVGKETLLVSREGFGVAKVTDLDLATRPNEPVRITLTEGGTIRGLVFNSRGKRAAGKVLHFQDGNHGGDYTRGRFATTATDNNGFFQVHNLPIQPISIVCEDEWRGNQIVRQTVLPRLGERVTVKFGGARRVTGVILADGKPLSTTRLRLADRADFGIMKALAVTDSQGRFTFFGPPSGVWSLFYEPDSGGPEWLRISEVEIGPETGTLGELSYGTTTLTINCEPGVAEKLTQFNLRLIEYNRVWPFGRVGGILRKRKTPADPLVIEHVAPGEYELVHTRKDLPTIRERVSVKRGDENRTIDLTIPVGSASISGTANKSIASPRSVLRLWTEDRRLQTRARIDKSGRFESKNLPAGIWLVCTHDTRHLPPIFRLKLKDGEAQTVDLTAENTLARPGRDAWCQILTYTADGVITPCHVTLWGLGGDVTPHTSDGGAVSFVATPGTYEATVRLRGFATQKRTIELKPITKDGRPEPGWQTHVVLEKL